MANNVQQESELYEPMRLWLQGYLEDRYRGADITTLDSHSKKLSAILQEHGVMEHYPHTEGLPIEIDVLGIIRQKNKVHLAFIEAKKGELNLQNLGQLWVYCKLCDPAEAFLFSSGGLGSLNKVLRNLQRTDLLNFGDGKRIKQMQVAQWDINAAAPDFKTLIPKL